RALASPQGRQQVARARKLQAQLDQIAAEVRVASQERATAPLTAAPRESLWEKLRSRVLAPVLRYGMAAAASIILLGGLWLLREDILSRQQIAQLTAERDLARLNEKDLQERIAAQRGDLTSQFENEKSRLDAERARNAQMRLEMRQLRALPP